MKLRLTILLLLFPALLAAQEISVEKFYLAESDQTANTFGTEAFDQNGNRCALIRIATTEKGFTFEGGSLGITKVDDNHDAEVWVYVPAGLRRITIHHSKLGNLYNYEFPISLQSGRTYIMHLITGKVHTVVEEDLGLQYLVFAVVPTNAVVYIDNELKTLNAQGSISLLLPYGKHTYRVEATSYVSESGIVEIGQQKVVKEVKLKSAKATLNISCTMGDAQIYVNEQLKGNGSVTCTLDAGNYIVEARKAGHRTQKQLVALAVQDNRKLQIQVPEPIYGTLNINSEPPDAEAWLDGKKLGTTPDIFRNILAGSHELELRKQGYQTAKRTVTIAEAKVESVNIMMEEVVRKNSLTVNCPVVAVVYLDGEKIGTTTSFFDDIPLGKHTLELRKEGYKKVKKKIEITEGYNCENIELVSVSDNKKNDSRKALPSYDAYLDFIACYYKSGDISNYGCGFSVGALSKVGVHLSMYFSMNPEMLNMSLGVNFGIINRIYPYLDIGWGFYGKKIEYDYLLNEYKEEEKDGIIFCTGLMFRIGPKLTISANVNMNSDFFLGGLGIGFGFAF